MRKSKTPSRADLLLLAGPAPPPKGGISVHLERLSHNLSALGIAHQILNESRLSRRDLLSLRTIGPFGYVALVARASHVHIHSTNPWVRLVHTLTARSLGCKVIQTFHSSRGKTESLLGRLCANLSHQNIAVSQAVASKTCQRATVAPAFLAPTEAEFQIEADVAAWIKVQKVAGKKVICANAFNTADAGGVEIYGLDLLLEAFSDKAFRSMYAAVICLSIPTPRPDRVRHYRALIAEHNAETDVLFLIGHRPFLGIISHSDVFVRPSSTDGDALSLREALWVGTSAVASDAAERPAGTVVFRSRDLGQMKQAIERAASQSNVGAKTEFLKPVLDAYEKGGLHIPNNLIASQPRDVSDTR